MLRIRIAVSREGEDHKLLFPPGPDDGENGERDPCGQDPAEKRSLHRADLIRLLSFFYENRCVCHRRTLSVIR